jgi:hypothetical protein
MEQLEAQAQLDAEKDAEPYNLTRTIRRLLLVALEVEKTAQS